MDLLLITVYYHEKLKKEEKTPELLESVDVLFRGTLDDVQDTLLGIEKKIKALGKTFVKIDTTALNSEARFACRDCGGGRILDIAAETRKLQFMYTKSIPSDLTENSHSGERISAYMNANKLNVASLAVAASISKPRLIKILTGDASTTLGDLEKLSRALSVPISELVLQAVAPALTEEAAPSPALSDDTKRVTSAKEVDITSWEGNEHLKEDAALMQQLFAKASEEPTTKKGKRKTKKVG